MNLWPSAVKAQGPDHWTTTGIPNVCVCFYCLFSERKTPFYPPPLLNWKVAQEKVPWGIVLLLGGGFAVAKGCEVTSPLPRRGQGGGLPRASSFTGRAAESLCTPPSQHPRALPLCFFVCLLRVIAHLRRTVPLSCHLQTLHHA